MNKRILTIFLVLLISCTTFISCNNDNVNQQDSTNITSENNYWTFDKLVEESDCCIVISKIEMINENSPELSRGVSREVENEFKMNVTLIEYNQNDLGKLQATIQLSGKLWSLMK